MLKIKQYQKQVIKLEEAEEDFITNYKLHMIIGAIFLGYLTNGMMPYFREIIINYIVKILYQVFS